MITFIKQLFFVSVFLLAAVIISAFAVIPFTTRLETYFYCRSECADVAKSFDRRLEDFKAFFNITFAKIRASNLGYRNSCEILGNCVDVLRNCSHIDKVKLEKKVQMLKNCCLAGSHALVGHGLDVLEKEEEEEQSDDLKCEWIEM